MHPNGLNRKHEGDLVCGYCLDRHEKGRISLRGIRRAWKLLPDGADIDVAFFGGEPLLAWRELVWAVADARREAVKGGVGYQVSRHDERDAAG